MRQAKVWRYWCDHCGKGGCGKGAAIKHEKHCTLNPLRSCRVCGVGPGRMLSAKTLVLGGCSVAELREAVEGCPACMLAAVRQARGRRGRYNQEDGENWPAENFDYKTESAEWWKTVNVEREVPHMGRCYG